MIVSCPSCHVNYRQVPPPVETSLAHCSRCDARFDVEPPLATYRLVPTMDAPVTERPAVPAYDAQMEIPAPPTVDEVLLDGVGIAEETPAETEEAVAEVPPSKGGSRVSGYGVVLGVLLTAVATASGYYLSLLGMTDMITGTAGGAGVGLVLALAVIRWTMRAR